MTASPEAAWARMGPDVVVAEGGARFNSVILDVASDGTNFLILHLEFFDLRASLISAAGELLRTCEVFSIAGNGAVGFDGVNYLVVQTAGSTVRGRRLSPSGDLLDDPPGFLIAYDPPDRSDGSGSGIPLHPITRSPDPAVAFDGENYLVVWQKVLPEGPNPSVHAARVAPDGTVRDMGTLAEGSGNHSAPAIAFNGRNFLVAWAFTPTNASAAANVVGVRVTPDGDILDSGEILIGEDATGFGAPRMAARSGQFLVVWDRPAGLVGKLIQEDPMAPGAPVGSNELELSSSPDWEAPANLEATPDGYWIVSAAPSLSDPQAGGGGSGSVRPPIVVRPPEHPPSAILARRILPSGELVDMPADARGLLLRKRPENYIRRAPFIRATAENILVAWSESFSGPRAFLIRPSVMLPFAPEAVPESFVAFENFPLNVQVEGCDPEGADLVFHLVSDATNGTVALQPDGHVTYTPNPGYSGADHFQFSVDDGEFMSEPALVTLDVRHFNQCPSGFPRVVPPVGVGAIGYLVISTNRRSATVLFDASELVDPEGDPLTYSWLEQPDLTVGTPPDAGVANPGSDAKSESEAKSLRKVLPDDCPGGKAARLEIRYLGEREVAVQVFGQKRTLFFDDALQPGQSFAVEGRSKKGEFGRELVVLTNGVTGAAFRTDGSRPIGPGTKDGEFIIVTAENVDGQSYCQLAALPLDQPVPFGEGMVAGRELFLGRHVIGLSVSDMTCTLHAVLVLEVVTPEAAVVPCLDMVERSDLDKKIRRDLTKLLEGGARELEKGNWAGAADQIRRFRVKVEAETGKSIGMFDATRLAFCAHRLLAAMGQEELGTIPGLPGTYPR